MFGRKKNDNASAASATQAPDREAILARLDAFNRANIELTKHGEMADAVVTAVDTRPPAGGLVEEFVTVNVQGSGGPFEATVSLVTLAMFGHDRGSLNEVGEERTVVFDPADHTKICFEVPNVRHSLRWRVPAACPACGAPVDQSRQGMAEHPVCEHCQQPLPAEPA